MPTRTRPAAVVPTVPNTAMVSLVSTPPGATVILNGQTLTGVTPLQLPLPPGKASVEFRLPNHQAATAQRNWTAGTADTVSVELTPLPARLSVQSTPTGATVRVNGVVLEGRTPLDKVTVPAGESQVIVELENHIPFMKRERLAPNADASIVAELQPMQTVVRFDSDPPGATILVNDKALDVKTPAGPMPMPPGHARVEFRLEGHANQVIERDWAPGGLDALMAKLAAHPGRARFESSTPWDSLSVDGTATTVGPASWLPLPAGPHRALAQRGARAAETEFIVPPGGDVLVTLNWANKRPSTTDYVELEALSAILGDPRFEDSNPIHAVNIAALWIARREVTVDEYRACVDANRCPQPPTGEACNWNVADRGNHPINCVSAEDATKYAAWLAEKEGIPYRLPTNDEWERAARGDGSRNYPWGGEAVGARCNTCDKSCPIERFRDDSFNDGRPETAPAGAMAYCVSSEGVVDLIGNVAEWTRVGAEGQTYQVRGGSWSQSGLFLEPALPVMRPPGDRDPSVGFRLVVSSSALPNIAPPTATAVHTATADIPMPTATAAAPEPQSAATPGGNPE